MKRQKTDSGCATITGTSLNIANQLVIIKLKLRINNTAKNRGSKKEMEYRKVKKWRETIKIRGRN